MWWHQQTPRLKTPLTTACGLTYPLMVLRTTFVTSSLGHFVQWLYCFWFFCTSNVSEEITVNISTASVRTFNQTSGHIAGVDWGNYVVIGPTTNPVWMIVAELLKMTLTPTMRAITMSTALTMDLASISTTTSLLILQDGLKLPPTDEIMSNQNTYNVLRYDCLAWYPLNFSF